MKPVRKVSNCEYCDAIIESESPPSRNQYEAGLIQIEEGTILLPDAVVNKNHKDDYSDWHAKDISGYYCRYGCLIGHIKDILRT